MALDERTLKPLIDSKVIKDVVDMFTPAAELTVEYGGKKVTNGVEISPADASEKPRFEFIFHGPSKDNFFTLVMVDPDAPHPHQPTMREWLHWMVVDIPQGMHPSKGKEKVEYMGPKPPGGIHRYAFVLFQQKGLIPKLKFPDARNNFSTMQFAADNDLGLPVAALYFTSQK
uniref:Mother of FT AND TFL1-like protein MFT1 n=1 Tax=Beta vulgaris TaxID=161934 RepID=E3UKF1_BETVU|nr:mother of FT AND TFL1-like protein MFT1 [Beta vulgaris]ADM92616.1 mother of FT AND TFL1-like protein MFT1 [Beta vulgaris]